MLVAATLSVGTAASPAQAPAPARFVYTGDANLAPFDYLDANGKPTGFSVDLIRALARDAGVEVEIRLGEWNQARRDFDAGRADLISLSYSEERARTYLWLARTWTVNQSLLFRKRPEPYPKGLDDLVGESIAVQERSLVAEILQALPPPGPRVTTVAAQAESVGLLRDNAVTAVGGGSLVLRVAAARLGMRDFVELPLRAVPYGFVSLKGRGAELGWVPSSMAHLKDAGVIEALAEKYLVAPSGPRTWRDYRYWAASILLAFLLAGLAALAWNRSLIRRVKERSRDMEEAMQRGETLMRSLAANEQRFQTFMTLSSEAIARMELEEPIGIDRPEAEQVDHIMKTARIVEANESFARLLRVASPAQVIGSRFGDHSSKDQVRVTALNFVKSSYRLVDVEARRERPDGEVQWVHANAIGVLDGKYLTGIWLTQQDITQRKEAEEHLRVRGRILDAVAFSAAGLLEPGPWKEHAPAVLARLGEAVGVGCAYIFENQMAQGALTSTLTYEWTEGGVPALVESPLFQNFRWPESGPVRSLLETRQTVASPLRDMPIAAQHLLGAIDLKSILIVPIFVGETWWGILGFGDFQHERSWSTAEVEALKTAGAALGAALLRERAEASLHASERKHRDIVDFAPEGIYQATRDGKLIMANQEFARLLGYDRSEDVLGLNLAQDVYFDASERERLIAQYESVGRAQRAEVRLKRRDGSHFWAEMSAHSVLDAAGNSLYFEGFIQDITTRREAEDELRASEERYRLLFDGNPIPMLIYDVATLGILAANEAAVVQYGYSRAELMTLTLGDLYSPMDPGFAAFVATRLKPRPDLDHVGPRQQVRKDGTLIEVDITSLALSFGGLRARLVLNRDVTAEHQAARERERLGQALERAADEWHRTFDAVDVAVLVLDQEGRLTRVNRPARKLLGREYAAIQGHTIEEMGSEEPWRSATAIAGSALRRHEGSAAQAVHGPDGQTWELTTYVTEAGSGAEERTILIVRDISAVVALQESLRRSETMSAMGSLVAGVAHEVRNPLFSISATVDALESELAEKQEYAELTALLRSQVGRLRQLMRDLLDYGKPPVLRMAQVQAHEILRRAIRACADLARERGVLLSEAISEDLWLRVDASRMEQVFQNLLANAIQHSPRGGEVHASSLAAADRDGGVLLRVEDEGTGMTPAETPRLFEPFFSRRKGGTGLGLSVVQRIVEAHGGRVSASNREGAGAAFTVRLPASAIETGETMHG